MKKRILFILCFSFVSCFLFSNVVYAKGVELGIFPLVGTYYGFSITNNGGPPIAGFSITISGRTLVSIDYYEGWVETVDGNTVTYEAESLNDMIFAGKGIKWWDSFGFTLDAVSTFSIKWEAYSLTGRTIGSGTVTYNP